MPKIIKVYNCRSNKRNVFETIDLRLWLKTRPDRERGNSVVALGLEWLKSGTPSKWETLWSGTIKTEDWGATVETKSKAPTNLTPADLTRLRSIGQDKPTPESVTKGGGPLPMQANTSENLRRWGRQPATIPISLMLTAEDLKEDKSASIVDFTLRGVGVLTSLSLFPGERVRIVAKGEFPDAIPTRVVWAREIGTNQWTYAGLEFLAASEA